MHTYTEDGEDDPNELLAAQAVANALVDDRMFFHLS
jgi:hypothetical protein